LSAERRATPSHSGAKVTRHKDLMASYLDRACTEQPQGGLDGHGVAISSSLALHVPVSREPDQAAMSAPDIAVVTVTYNVESMILDWVHALQLAWSEMPDGHSRHLRVLAIDNASQDSTVQRLHSDAPWVEVISLPTNRGFAAGCNLGLSTAHGSELFVLLNPDVVVAPDFFVLLARLQWPGDLAARGPSVRTPAGVIEQSARAFPRASTGLWGRTTLLTRLFPRIASRELLADPARGRHKVDWVSGACLVMTGKAIAGIGMMDEGYFMYWEDADWCKRAHDKGFCIEFEPALNVVHQQGSSSASRPIATTIAFHRSAYRYYRLHVARGSTARTCAALILTMRCAVKLAILFLRSKQSPQT
jgi:N-acetylglucosaminyl-diphospho-decaprenol L-rhamnosyltransferase